MVDPTPSSRMMSVDPKLLLESSESMAYHFATYAAAQNDHETLRSFLDVGLDASVTSHTSKRRGGEKMLVNPWLKAIENDAIDCVRVMMEHPKARPARLMSLRPDSKGAVETALLNAAEQTLAFWHQTSVKHKLNPDQPLSSEFGGKHLVGLAAALGDEASVRWLLSQKASTLMSNNSYGQKDLFLEHFLAWGDCAQVLDERLQALPECAQTCLEALTPSGLTFIAAGSNKNKQWSPTGAEALALDLSTLKDRLYANTVYTKNMGQLVASPRAFAQQGIPSSYVAAITPLSPVSCALINESGAALNVFVNRLGRQAVDEQAKKTLRFLLGVRETVQVHVGVERLVQENRHDEQLDRAIAVCERWMLSIAPTASSSAHAGEGNPSATTPRRRAVRL